MKVSRLDAAVQPTLRSHEARIVDTRAIVAGWANATPDTIHFDGGVLRSWHDGTPSLRDQPVTRTLLDALVAKMPRGVLCEGKSTVL